MPVLVPLALGAAVLAFPPTRRRAVSATKVVAETGVGVAGILVSGTIDAVRAVVSGNDHTVGGAA
jgi:hypothetical protein